MLNDDEKEVLNNIIHNTLNRCEKLWSNTLGDETQIRKAMMAESAIPGCPFLGKNQYKSDLFVCLMLDMRDSTKHLRQAISAKIARVSQMQRVFYEVSALLPAMTKVINDKNGSVTEYLGDGLLALFQLPTISTAQEPILLNVIRAANNCMQALNEIINPILFERYKLPSLEIGIGLSYSDAIISHFGLHPNTQIKVLGECIYLASSLSKERNKIVIHENLKKIWPTSKNGQLRFEEKAYKDIKGYIVMK